MYKGCDRMRYGTCQYYKENIADKLRYTNQGDLYNQPWQYNTYCSSFDNFEKCPYYSYKNFNNQQVRDQYKKNQKADANGSLITLVVVGAIIFFILKRFGVF